MITMAISIYGSTSMLSKMIEVNFFNSPFLGNKHLDDIQKVFREIFIKYNWNNELHMWFYNFTANVTVIDMNDIKHYKAIYYLHSSTKVSQIIIILMNFLEKQMQYGMHCEIRDSNFVGY